MHKIAEFKIVSGYGDIKLPCRATSGSAGYDFFLPHDVTLAPHEQTVIKTGVRAFIEDGWFLMICPRSGLGFKYAVRLANTVGIIDSDYYYSDNEGHICIKLINGDMPISLLKGSAFAQGIFVPYGITYDDCCTAKRNGGMGSTDKK